jgi:hypothetical protein
MPERPSFGDVYPSSAATLRLHYFEPGDLSGNSGVCTATLTQELTVR